jgi:hypothetical protein
LSFAAATAASTFDFSPETMIWPGALKLAASIPNSAQSSVDLGAFLAYDRGHAADGLLAGQLHQPAALGDDLEAGREIKHAGGGQGGDFAEAQAQGELDGGQLAGSRKAATRPAHAQTALADRPSSGSVRPPDPRS